MDDPVAGEMYVPGATIKMSKTPGRIGPRAHAGPAHGRRSSRACSATTRRRSPPQRPPARSPRARARRAHRRVVRSARLSHYHTPHTDRTSPRPTMDVGHALRRELPAVARFVHRLRGSRSGGALSTLAKGLASGVGQPTQIVVRSQKATGPRSGAATCGHRSRLPRRRRSTSRATWSSPPSWASARRGLRDRGHPDRADRRGACGSLSDHAPRPLGHADAGVTQPFHLVTLPRADDSVTFVAESPSR